MYSLTCRNARSCSGVGGSIPGTTRVGLKPGSRSNRLVRCVVLGCFEKEGEGMEYMVMGSIYPITYGRTNRSAPFPIRPTPKHRPTNHNP